MSFASLIYTDVSREESISFRTGFQFHAISEDVGIDDERLAHNVLYVVPHLLVQRRLEIEAFPQSFAYLGVEDKFLVARGKYLGRMADGRSGNQITHCIVSHEANDFVDHLPAQLFGASVWRLQKSSSTTLPLIKAPLSIDSAFELSALHSLATGSRDAMDTLPRFLTMIEQASREPRTRLVLLHADLQTIAQWISLGTLFLDRETALSTSFYVFSDKPLADSRFAIVGIDPEMTRQYVSSDTNCLDLRSFQGTEVEVDDTALAYARWFLQASPSQALEAVHLNRRWQRFVSSDVAIVAAERVVLDSRHGGNPARASATVLRALATQQESDDLATFGSALVDAVHEFDANDIAFIELLGLTILALRQSSRNELMVGCTLAALEAAALSSEASSLWVRAMGAETTSSTIEWPDQDASNHAAGLLTTILGDAPDDILPEVFSLARWLNTGLSYDHIDSSISRLAQLWASNPGLEPEYTSWLHGERVQVAVCETLSARFHSPQRSDVVTQLLAGTWDWAADLPSVFTPESPLFPWLLSRKLTKLSTAERRQTFEQHASQCTPASWAAFFEFSAPLDIQLLDVWLRAHPTVDPGLATVIEKILTQRLKSSKEASSIVTIVDLLIHHQPDGLTEASTQLMNESDDFVRWTVEAVSVDHRLLRPNAPLERIASDCRRMIALRYRRIASLATECHDIEASARILSLHQIDWRNEVLESLSGRLAIDPTDAVYVATLIWSHHGFPADLREAVALAVKDWWHNPRNRDTMLLVQQSLDDSFHAQLGTMLKAVTPLRERLQRGDWRRVSFRSVAKDRNNG